MKLVGKSKGPDSFGSGPVECSYGEALEGPQGSHQTEVWDLAPPHLSRGPIWRLVWAISHLSAALDVPPYPRLVPGDGVGELIIQLLLYDLWGTDGAL